MHNIVRSVDTKTIVDTRGNTESRFNMIILRTLTVLSFLIAMEILAIINSDESFVTRMFV